MAVKKTTKTAAKVAKTATKKATQATEAATTAVASDAGAAPVAVKVKRREFVSRVAAKANLRPNQVKPVVEAVLAELGDLLVKGETLRHPQLGKLSVNRQKDVEGADVVICKLRRPTATAPTTAPDPLATAAE